MDCEPKVSVDWSPNEVPNGLYRRLLFRWPSGMEPNRTLPRICCERKGIQVDAKNLADYRFVIQQTGSDESVPLMYPHALFGSAHLLMIGHERFSIGALGLLHLRNHIVRYRPFGVEYGWDMKCELARQRQTEKGLEFDFDATVAIENEIVWRSVSTYLKRRKPIGELESSRLGASFPSMGEASDSGEFDVPHNIGKRYAKVTGDYNPIHVSNLAAKLFGFKRAIAHGMWSVARSLVELPQPRDSDTPVRHDVAFKGPMFVASKAHWKTGAENRFDVFCGSNPRPVVVGVYRECSADEVLA